MFSTKPFLVLMALSISLSAETTIPEALKSAETDLTRALSALEKTREEIAAEKPELSAEYRKVEQELQEKRRLIRIARQSRMDRAEELRGLQRDYATRSQDAGYIAGMLKDYALKSDTQAPAGTPAIEVSPEIIAATADDPAEALESRLVILDAALAQMEEIMGGSKAPGQAVDSDGNVIQGTIAAVGPASYFLAEDKSTGGDLLSTDSAGMHTFISGDTGTIGKLFSGSEAKLALDPTGGDARAMEEINGGPLELVRKGGLWIWPIMFLAVLSLFFGIVKLAQFLRYREPSEAWITAILAALRNGDRAKAAELAASQNHPAGAVMEKLVAVSDQSQDLAEETLYEQLMGVQEKVGSMLPVVAITAATAPLLGLLGTVSGMISTFNLITLFGSGDPKPLAGGISEALITTLFGLVVAIPALILHAFLSRRATGITQKTERLGLSFINGLRVK
ncbi:MotA/TolQ/ExbB proton channel family protein [Luteolibacter sp. AS25]|uniref:MotA/TolQ/ExbB proton channel family protein n=1 Tax=Luteolibacter sp. AS25 TaxID=3135776 RepID=UPI00398AD0CE